jgi:HNH endonuclease
MREHGLGEIFAKTQGYCHFCGDRLVFENRGWTDNPNGHWEVDHVTQRDKGGSKKADNCLPACTACNRLRWHRTGASVQGLLLLGVIAAKEIKNGTSMGRELKHLRMKRLAENKKRRQFRKRVTAPYDS